MTDSARSTIIAVCGKGGVGKTSVSALLTKILVEEGSRRVLAIDADPAMGLSYALGITIGKTVDNIRSDLIDRIKGGERADKQEVLARLDYEILEAIAERDNLAFLAIGRPEDEGCYCQVNSLLKDIIREIAASFDYVIIDGEAGIEQINRRVLEPVTHLLLISDTSIKGRAVAATLEHVARRTTCLQKVALLFNRVKDMDELQSVLTQTKLPVIGWIFEDETIRRFDREGRSFFDLPSCDALESLEKVRINLERGAENGIQCIGKSG
jgi:CO dehydrogenase maturation factor